MKNFVVKIALFHLCFALGNVFVWRLSSSITVFDNYPTLAEKPEFEMQIIKKARKGNGLEVKFSKFVQTENGLVADFEISNYTSRSYFYKANIGASMKEPFFAFYQLKIGGNKPPMMWCGTGTTEFELKPGDSKIFRVINLSYHWKKNKSVQVGYYFRHEEVKESQIYWSDKLPIDDSATELLFKDKERWKGLD